MKIRSAVGHAPFPLSILSYLSPPSPCQLPIHIFPLLYSHPHHLHPADEPNTTDFPCGGQDTISSNRTLWPITGGEIVSTYLSIFLSVPPRPRPPSSSYPPFPQPSASQPYIQQYISFRPLTLSMRSPLPKKKAQD